MKLTHDAQTTKAVAQLVGYAFNKQHALDQDEIFYHVISMQTCTVRQMSKK